MSWPVEHRRGDVDRLHHDGVTSPGRQVLVMSLDRPAVALGSTQSDAVLDPRAVAASGREVTRRHSGGGLVVMDPADVLWVDVIIPAHDPLWRVDVGEAFVWLGRAWADAVASQLPAVSPPPVVHRGAPRHSDLGRVVCFAGVGSGEVTVGDRKVVGMSQRRTRELARFQCLVHRRFDPAASMSLLGRHLSTGGFAERLGDRLTTGVGTVGDLDALFAALLDALPSR